MNQLPLISMATSARLCPFALCERIQDTVNRSTVCSCELRQTIVVCPSCSALNRAGAHYCRACRAYLEPPAAASIAGEAPKADFLSVRGCFRRPPLLANGLLYLLDIGGKLISIAPRSSAQSSEVAQLKFGRAGFNAGAIVEAAHSQKGLRGYLYLAVSPSGLEAVSLATRQVSLLYKPQENEKILANSIEADSPGFKGVAATPNFCAVAVRTSGGEIALTLVYFSGDRPVEQPLKISGADVCGPALSGQFIILCSEESIGVLDIDSGRTRAVPLPENFLPMMNREAKGIGVPLSQMPMAAVAADSGPHAWIAGYRVERIGGQESHRPVLLEVSLDRGEYSFHDVANGESFAVHSLPEGRFFTATSAGIEFPGQPDEPALRHTMRAAMPVGFDAGRAAYFYPDPEPGWRKIAIGSGAAAVSALFPDQRNECNEDSCCGILIDRNDVVVPFLKFSTNPGTEGLKLAHWRFA